MQNEEKRHQEAKARFGGPHKSKARYVQDSRKMWAEMTPEQRAVRASAISAGKLRNKQFPAERESQIRKQVQKVEDLRHRLAAGGQLPEPRIRP